MMQNARTDLRSQALDLLRFPLAVVVILIHSFLPSFMEIHGTDAAFDDMPLLRGAYAVVQAFLKSQSVPIYYFISGYVFFLGIRSFDRATYLRKMRNRARSLFIPFVVWNMLAVVAVMALMLPCFGNVLPGMSQVELHFTPRAVLHTFCDHYQGVVQKPFATPQPSIYPLNVPLWFIRELMIVALCSPLIRWFVLRCGRAGLFALGAVWLGVQGFVPFGYPTMLLTAFFFFTWGASMSVRGRDMIGEFGRVARPMALAYVALAVAHLYVAPQWPAAAPPLKALTIVAGLFTAFNVAAYLLRRGLCRVNSFLAGSSFFLYISHWIVFDKCLKVAFAVLCPHTAVSVLVAYATGLVFTVCLLLGLYAVLRRYAPCVLRAIAGAK